MQPIQLNIYFKFNKAVNLLHGIVDNHAAPFYDTEKNHN
jgi:hypothetical protein